MEFIYLFVGLVLGAAMAWLFLRPRLGKGTANSEEAERRISEITKDRDELKQELSRERENILSLSRQLASREAEYKALQERIMDQKRELGEIQAKFSAEFKNLANEILEEKTKKFTDQNKTSLDEILKPLSAKLTDFEKKVEESNQQSIARNSALREQISGLKEMNTQITKEAENLTRALKGDTRSQGKWGELILENILEKSGLEKGREYHVQESFTGNNGRRLQPDVIVGLPENKNIIIDSKVSLTAFERYSSEEDDSAKESFVKDHLMSVRAHIKNLSGKNYQGLYGVKGLDFVLMFIPVEPAFSLAVQNDSALFNDAYEKNIVIVSPSTLIATLRTIANIWKNEYQNQNAMEIARQAGDLYDKFVNFTEDLITVGKNIGQTQKAYEEAMKKLSEGRGNLVKRAENIRKLGATPSKNIDQRLIGRSEDSPNS